MNKIYNNYKNFTSSISKFLQKFDFLTKPNIKNISDILYGMIKSESSVSRDIALTLPDTFECIQTESKEKRINRFFNNDKFDGSKFYYEIIKHVIANYKKKHRDKRVHIIIDHMFSHENFTVLMFALRVGKQGIPLWFKCFKGGKNSDAFKRKHIYEGINRINNLFDDKFNIIFLADRWFGSTKYMSYIGKLNHTYVIRIKGNILVHNNDNNILPVKKLTMRKYHSYTHSDVKITSKKYPTNVVISKATECKERWFLATNGDPKRAIKDYGYRFGGIETLFKNFKSNGFRLEAINHASITYFTNMFAMVCFATLFMVILGTEYSRNTSCYKNIKITTHKVIKGIKKRVVSLFKVGLTLIKISFTSRLHVRIPYRFVLYDI